MRSHRFRDPVWVSYVLQSHISSHGEQVLAVDGRCVKATSPFDGPRDSSVGPKGTHTFRQAYEVTQACVRTKADNDVDVIGQSVDCQRTSTGASSGIQNCVGDFSRKLRTYTGRALPRVPGDVSVELKRVMIRHPHRQC